MNSKEFKGNDRLYYIDVLKAIGIIAIVLDNMYPVCAFDKVLKAFHVPLFFFVSGLFINVKIKPMEFIKKKFFAIMFPYYGVSLISIALYVFLGEVLGRISVPEIEKFSIIANIKGMLFANCRTGLMAWNRPLWFLPCLFMASLLTYAIEKAILFWGGTSEGDSANNISIIDFAGVVFNSISSNIAVTT